MSIISSSRRKNVLPLFYLISLEIRDRKATAEDKFVLLQEVQEDYQNNLGLTIERNEENNLVIYFDHVKLGSYDRCSVELKIKDQDQFEGKCNIDLLIML